LFKNLAVLKQVPLNLPHNGGKFSFFSREVVQKLRFLNNSIVVAGRNLGKGKNN
jgi:hypothetical protein